MSSKRWLGTHSQQQGCGILWILRIQDKKHFVSILFFFNSTFWCHRVESSAEKNHANFFPPTRGCFHSYQLRFPLPREKKCRQNPRLVINSPLFFHYYFLEATECGLASSPPFWGRGGRLCDNDHNSPRKKRTRRRLKGGKGRVGGAKKWLWSLLSSSSQEK